MSTELEDEIKYLIEVQKGYESVFENLIVEFYSFLWDSWKKNTGEAIDEMIINDQKDLDKLLGLFSDKLKEEFSLESEEIVSKTIKEVFRKTKSKYFNSAVKSLREVDFASIKYLKKHTNWWVSNYYDKFPGEKISELISDGLRKEMSTPELGEMLKNYFEGKVLEDDEIPQIPSYGTPKRYFEGLARSTVTNSRMASTINDFIQTEINEYEIIETQDGRTCAKCRNMHGRIFKVSRAKRYLNKYNSLKSPEDVKTELPWIKDMSELDKPSKDLPLSFCLPQFHWGCRGNVIAREMTIEEEAELLLSDEKYAKEFPDNMLLATDSKNVKWSPQNIEEARMMVKLARKEYIPQKELREFIKKCSWRNEETLSKHYTKHGNGIIRLGFKIDSMDDYAELSKKLLLKSELWGTIETRNGFPVIYGVNNYGKKKIFSVIHVKGMTINSMYREDKFYKKKLKREKEFYYRLKKEAMKMSKFEKIDDHDYDSYDYDVIATYQIKIVSDFKKSSWEDFGIEGGPLYPPCDADSIQSDRDVIHHKFPTYPDEEKMRLKAIDELLLKDIDATCDLFSALGDDKSEPKEKWWWHFQAIKDGKLKVFWDEEKKVYTTE